MKKLNNKGYMLVEIILASTIAFGLAYFILDLTIKLKYKNDDLMVETLVATDKAIISNKIMDYFKLDGSNFRCNQLVGSGNAIYYTPYGTVSPIMIAVVNDYTTIESITCDRGLRDLFVDVDLMVNPGNKLFNFELVYRYV